MKLSKLLFVILPFILTGCGGGSSSGNQENVVEPLSFKATTTTLFSSDENSEPMDLTSVSVNSDVDDDETAFVEIMKQITKE